MTWHFHLAAKKMREEGMDLAMAYRSARKAYQDLRVADRIEAFVTLLRLAWCVRSSNFWTTLVPT